MSPGKNALPRTADIVIIGGGIAGLAAATELAARRAGSIVLLEAEPAPGRHSTAKNASLLLQHTEDPVAAQLALASRSFYLDTEDGEPVRFRPVGSLLLVSGADSLARCRARIESAARLNLAAELITAEESRRRVPILESTPFDAAAWCATDGVIEIEATVEALIRRAVRGGVSIYCGVRAVEIRTADGAVTGLTTSAGAISAGTVVIAAGAAAGPLGERVGAPLPLRVTSRHLVVTEPWERVDPDWPFVWDLNADFYFRPDAGALLLCSCDVVDAPDGSLDLSDAAVTATRELAARLLPGMAGLATARSWAGLRTLTPDDRFVIGPDPRLRGLAWLAGLGGHGMAGGPAAGKMLAQLLAGDTATLVDPAVVGPGRFTTR